MYDLMDVLRLAGIGFAIFAIEQLLEEVGKKGWIPYIRMVGIIVALFVVMDYITTFFDTVQTLFTF